MREEGTVGKRGAVGPETGGCSTKMRTLWDEKEKAWIVDLKKGKVQR